MAQSPAHQFGQIIGDTLEAALLPILHKFAEENGLLLDRKGERPCRKGKKCSWIDANGNTHDLDFVLERGGSSDHLGTPVAFIETAWRRYTKHSRNKAQEIQGAIEPLAEKYRFAHPFKGAVLAGVYTNGAITQLQSLGYSVLHLTYDHVVAVFRQFGIDAASDESTSDQEFRRKVTAFRRLTLRKKHDLAQSLISEKDSQTQEFIARLSRAIRRTIERIVVLALHGSAHEAIELESAIQFIEAYSDAVSAHPIVRFEVEVTYSNGDTIRGSFGDKSSAVDFLRGCRPMA
jgi:hypothetical protein